MPLNLRTYSPARLLFAILLLAAALRLYGLADESLWLDEGYTARRATESFRQLAAEFRHETQTGLYYVGERIWCAAFGTSEFALRFPSVIFGIAAVLGIFLLAREIFASTVGLFAALILALNPFAIYYSQEARPYGLFLAASTFSLYYLMRLLRRVNASAIIGYLFSTVITLYTHPLAPLLLVVHGIVWLIYLRDEQHPVAAKHPFAVIGMISLAGFFYLPQLLFMWRTIVAKTQGASSASWIPVPNLYAFVQTLRQYFMHPALAVLAAVMLVAAFVFVVRRDARVRRGMLLLLAVVFGAVIAPWIISKLLTPVYVDRYTIPALAAVVIAVAWVLLQLRPRMRVLLLSAFLALNVFALTRYYSYVDKEPWRETAQFVSERARAGDLVVMGTAYTRDVFTYYYHAPEGVTVASPWSVKDIHSNVNTASRIILVQAYNAAKQPSTKDLLARVARNRTAGPATKIEGKTPFNPWAYWQSPIIVTVYERPPDSTLSLSPVNPS